ncbi:hypothetical protein Tco_0033844 [Tanacetum coccineum]
MVPEQLKTQNIQAGAQVSRLKDKDIFGHVHDFCPKNATAIPTVETTNDGFQTVVNKRKGGKTSSYTINRSEVNVGKNVWQPINQKVRFEPKASGNTSKNEAPKMSTTSIDRLKKAHTYSKKHPAKAVDIPSSSNTSSYGATNSSVQDDVDNEDEVGGSRKGTSEWIVVFPRFSCLVFVMLASYCL